MENDNKNITIEDLAGMVHKGFLEAQEDREKIKEEINEIKNKLFSLEKRVMFIEDKITEHSKILREHSEILRKHSEELREIKILVQKFQEEKETDREKVVWLEKRVDRLEAKVGI